MSNGVSRLVWIMPLVLTLFGCQTSLPLPPLPPPGPVTTADDAIRIAINACNPSAYDARDANNWQARLHSDRWIASWSRAGMRRAPRGVVTTIEVTIHAQDGKPEPCGQYESLPENVISTGEASERTRL